MRTSRRHSLVARLYAGLRRAAHPIPAKDLWIAASAMEHGLVLLTCNRHFDEIDGLALKLL